MFHRRSNKHSNLDRRTAHHMCECSYRRAICGNAHIYALNICVNAHIDARRRRKVFNVGQVVVLNTPPARFMGSCRCK